jgi:hypothetical protein
MCAPRVTRHTSIRYSSSRHRHASTWAHRCNDPCLEARITAAVKNIDASAWVHRCIDPCLKARINAAVKNIDLPMSTRVWQELEYRIDVCLVTRGAHIEHL